MTKTKRLTPAMQRVLGYMENGWTLYKSHGYFTAGQCWLWQHYTIKRLPVQKVTVRALLRRRLIREIPERQSGKPTVYELVTNGD